VEYELTERGHRLEPILVAMWAWGHEDLAPGRPHPLTRAPAAG
jgi:DNA-binding HxlR family transcriptional regulator